MLSRTIQKKILVMATTLFAASAMGLGPTGCASAAPPAEGEAAESDPAALAGGCTPGQPCCGQNGSWGSPDMLVGLAGSAAQSCLGEDPDAFPNMNAWTPPTNLGICCGGAGSDGTCNGPGATNVGNATFVGGVKDPITSATSWWHNPPISCQVPNNPVSCQLISDNCAGSTEKTAQCDIEFKSTSTLSGSITASYSATGSVEFEAKAIGCGGSAGSSFTGSVSATGSVSGTWEVDSTSHPSITVPGGGCINGPSLLYPSIAKTYWFLPVNGHVTMKIGTFSKNYACNSRSLGGKATMVTKLYDHGAIAPLGQCAPNDGQSGYDTSKYCGELPPQPHSGPPGGSGGSGGGPTDGGTSG